MSFSNDAKKTTTEHIAQRSSSVRFKASEFERNDSSRSHPIWRPAFDSETDSTPQYRSVKPVLTPTTGRSSAVSMEPSPIPTNEFERPQKFTLTTEQLSSVARDSHVLKPKAVSATSAAIQPNPYATQSSHSPQFYMAVAGPPYHNQNNVIETSSHVKTLQSMECSERIMTSSSKRITFDDQKYHQSNTFDTPTEQIPFTVSPTPSITRQKLRPPPTPTKFIPGEFRESDYDSEIESIKIRPVWTPNQFADSENVHYRHVSPPTSNHRGASVPKHHFERILTPMEFDVSEVEMPTSLNRLPSSASPLFENRTANQFKTQTLDRFRSKKKTTSQLYSSSQDDINVMHSTPKYSRCLPATNQSYENELQSCPTYREESRESQCGKSILLQLISIIRFVWIVLTHIEPIPNSFALIYRQNGKNSEVV